ncbi:MAG: MFS transporter [Gammaproteobacteria bacterium]|nr:MFS transporter [Gammaproteobacteria bacterium]TVQ47506.1 MAG: MFS transporter [Gammaproteobacteria bacterium]
MGGQLSGALSSLRGPPLTVFLICLLGWTLSNLDQSLMGYAIPGILREFDIGLDVIGLILSISFVFAAFAVVFLGMLADRLGRRRLFVLVLAVSAGLVGLHAIAVDVVTLTILRALAFGIAAALAPITAAYVMETSPTRLRGVMMGLLQCGYPLGWFFASLLASPIMALYGWRAIFLLAFLVVPAALLLGRHLPESDTFLRRQAAASAGDSMRWREQLAELFRAPLRRRTLLCWMAFFCHGCAYAGTAFYFPSFFAEARGYSESAATLLVGIAYGIGVLGYIAAAFIGEYVLTRRNTIIVWCWLGTAAFLGLVWLPTSYAQDLVWFSVMAMFFYGVSAVLITYVTELFPTRVRATGTALAGSAGLSTGFAVAPVVVAAGVGLFGWHWAFTLLVAPPLFLVGVFMLGLDNLRSGVDVDAIDAGAAA